MQTATEIRRQINELKEERAASEDQSERRDLQIAIEELRHRLWMMGETETPDAD